MLDVLALIYFTLSNLYLLGNFPLHIYEFIDLERGFAVSDYGVLLETGTYFGVSAIITGLLCGLDAVTFPLYKKSSKWIYNIHALTAFGILGIGLVPSTDFLPGRALHWAFALSFIIIYPLARLYILRKYKKKLFKKLLITYLVINVLALLVSIGVQFKFIVYPEYLMWVSLLSTIIISKLALSKRYKK